MSCNGGRSCSDRKSVTIDHQGRLPPPPHHQKPIRKVVEAIQIDPKLIVFDGTKQSLPQFQQAKDPFLLGSSPMSVASSKRSEEVVPVQDFINRKQMGVVVAAAAAEVEDPRISLEVFGSKPVVKKLAAADMATMNVERKLSMLAWDAIPKAQTQSLAATTTASGSGGGHEEIESDASSDLFEIENISSNNGWTAQQPPPPRFTQRQYESMSSCMMTPTSVYEPSEASIEWSVVTASAADFSVNQDYDEKRVAENYSGGGGGSSKNLGKSGQRGRPSGILGCKSQKAVRVVEPGPVNRSGGGGGIIGNNEKSIRGVVNTTTTRTTI